MNTASQFRAIARDVLKDKWGLALITGLLASMLRGVNNDGLSFRVSKGFSFDTLSISEYIRMYFYTEEGSPISVIFLILFILSFLLFVTFSLFGSIIRVGYSKFNLQLIEKENTETRTLFLYFKYWKTIICASILKALYVIIGFVLLIIPGIIATYSYSMTSFILAEEPQLTASEAVAKSKELMDGNRFSFFCLQLSFIGWDVLAILTLGIGDLWLTPYKQAAYAAFYKEISNS